jgi:signal transduction histidine kinase
MNAPKTPSLRWTLRWIEWIVILANLLSGLLSTYFRESPELLIPFMVYTLAFFALSFVFPSDRPLWQRRAYIAVEIILVVSAAWIRLWFTLVMYFVLAKSCFLLKRRDVVVAAVLNGIGYLSGNAWTLPQRIAQTIAQLQTQAPEEVYNPRAIFLVSSVEYLGASFFVVLLGFVMVAERQSRKRAEALAEEVKTLAATLERTRIARDIHDSLGHTLTTLDVQLEVAQKLRHRNPEQALQALDTANLLTKQCLQDVRRALQTIHQPNFDLATTLENLLEQIGQFQPIKIRYSIELPPLPLQTSHQLYCIVQEGLTNIQKHAQASQIELKIGFDDVCMTLDLIDNGRGFNPAQSFSGFGLRGMYERTQIIGGTLKINSILGQGTQIQVQLPR